MSPPTTLDAESGLHGLQRIPGRLRGDRRDGPPMDPILPGQRHGLDIWSWTGAAGIPYEGNYSAYLDSQAQNACCNRKPRNEDEPCRKTLAKELEWIQAARPEGPPQESPKPGWPAYDDLLGAITAERDTPFAQRKSLSRTPGPRPGRRRHRCRTISARRLGTGPADRWICPLQTCPRAGSWGVIGPERAPVKTTLFPHDHRSRETPG
jgi:hypothetical protein